MFVILLSGEMFMKSTRMLYNVLKKISEDRDVVVRKSLLNCCCGELKTLLPGHRQTAVYHCRRTGDFLGMTSPLVLVYSLCWLQRFRKLIYNEFL